MVSRKEQILMMGGGLMVAIGFMFMGAASLSGLTPDGNTNQGNQQEITAEMPNSTYSTESYGLGVNQQAQLAFENEVVFVNAIYENQTEFEYLEGLDEEFDGRVYVNYQNSSESDFTNAFDITEFPTIVVIGDQQTEQGPYLDRPQNNRESVKQSICNGMRNVGDQAAVCF
ncbi:MAG: hypothetical protein R6V35_01080 [Candidatus Nanohaloarchaea archaeon]